ncbi:helix-turn-helix transcriptional regulator [Enterococcus sp. LJL98]
MAVYRLIRLLKKKRAYFRQKKRKKHMLFYPLLAAEIMNKDFLSFYTNLTKFLGSALGNQYEIILHVFDSGNFHVAAIENSHVSGRTIDSPLSGFALNLIQSEIYQTKDFVADYKTQTVDGKSLRGSTFFIKGENGELQGMLCINQDTSRYEELSREILALANGPNTIIEEIATIDRTEILDETIEGIIYAIVSPDLLKEKTSLSKELKVEVVRHLNEKGIFQIKGAVARVSEILHISEPSVYRYLKMVEHESL